MTSNHFLVKQESVSWPYAFVEGAEHDHLSKVLRVRPGRRIWILDERGTSYLAEVEAVERGRTRLLLLDKIEPRGENFRLILGQALIKSKAMDLVVQKAVELGSAAIIPVKAQRSVVRIEGREQGKLERWRKIAREAVKQSHRVSVPQVLPPQTLSAFLASQDHSRGLILCETRGEPLRDVLASGIAQRGEGGVRTVSVLVGPEGGWTQKEEERALEKKFEAVSLGRQALRSETAALAAVAMISHFRNG